MYIYLVINVENLKIYEPSMIMGKDGDIWVLTVDEFVPEYLDELFEDVILDKRTRFLHWGDVEYFWFGLKGGNPSKVKWIEFVMVRKL